MSWYLFANPNARGRKPINHSKSTHDGEETGSCTDLLVFAFVMTLTLFVFPLAIYYTNSSVVMIAYIIWIAFVALMKFFVCKYIRRWKFSRQQSMETEEGDIQSIQIPETVLSPARSEPLINGEKVNNSGSVEYLDVQNVEPPLEHSTPKNRSLAEYQLAMEMPYADMDKTTVTISPPSPHTHRVTAT